MRAQIELIPVFRTTNKFEPIQLMDGVELKIVELPKDWPTANANTYLVINWKKIKSGKFFKASKLTDIDILHAFYAYNFFRTDTQFNNNDFKNVRYIAKGSKLEDIYNDEHLICDNDMKYDYGPFKSASEPYHDPSNLFDMLRDGSEHFEKYLKYVDAGGAQFGGSGPMHIANIALGSAFNEHQSWPEPQTIATFTALEALFSKDSTEVSFKLGHNLAYFLYPKPNQYLERLDFLKNRFKGLYNFRSEVAHGVREVDETGDNFEQCLALLREVMRKVIEQHSLPDVFYIRSGHDEFIDLLQIGHLQFKKIPDLIDKKRAAKEINYLIQTLSKGEADTTRNKMIEDLKRQLAELKSK